MSEHPGDLNPVAGKNLTLAFVGSNRSAAFASKGKPIDALADAEKCIQLEPSFARSAPRRTASPHSTLTFGGAHHRRGYGRKGLALYKLGRYADSITAYGAGLKKDPDNKSLKDGVDAATKAKQVMDANMAGYGRGGGILQHVGWDAELTHTELGTMQAAAVVATAVEPGMAASP